METSSLHPFYLYHVSDSLKMSCRKVCHFRTSCKCFKVFERFSEKGQDNQQEVGRGRKDRKRRMNYKVQRIEHQIDLRPVGPQRG